MADSTTKQQPRKLGSVYFIRVKAPYYEAIIKAAAEQQRSIANMGNKAIGEWLEDNGYIDRETDSSREDTRKR